MNITRISIDRPVVLWIVFGLVMLAGVSSFFRLNYELVPKFNPPVLAVVTTYPGALARQVEEEVSIPIEDALSGIEGIDVMTTTSQDNFSLVRLEMVAGVDIDEALSDANRKLLTVASVLPDGASVPVLSRFDFDDLPIMRLSLFAELYPEVLSSLSRELIIPRLQQVPGVADIQITGNTEKIVAIEVSASRLQQTNTTILQVLQALGKQNIRVPAGSITDGNLQQQTVLNAYANSLDELRSLTIFEKPEYGLKVLLEDIANVRWKDTAPITLSRLNGISAIGLALKKRSDANAVEVSRLVRKEIEVLEEEQKEAGLSIQVAQDTSIFTLNAARSVGEDLTLAIVLVSLVMLLFLHSLRNSIIVFFSIPICILSTFIAMVFLGYSLNLLSLLGLSLAIGILVDDSIVVIENIHRHLVLGKKSREAAYIGRMEIGPAAVSITLIDVVVFLPLVFASGMVADLLREFSVVIVVSTLMSLLVSFTLVPYLASRFHKNFKAKAAQFRLFEQMDGIINAMIEEVIGLLNVAMRYKLHVLILVLVMFGGAISLVTMGLIGVEFTKAGDRSEFMLELAFRPGTPLKKTAEYTRMAEDLLLAYPSVERVVSTIGSGTQGRITINNSHLAELYVRLIDKSDRQHSASQYARHFKYQLIEQIPGLEARPIDINIIGLRDDDAVQVTAVGQQDAKVLQAGTQLKQLLEQVPGAVEVQSSLSRGLPSLQIDPERNRMALLGIAPAVMGVTLRTAVNGNDDFSFHQGDEVFPIRVGLQEEDISSTDLLAQVPTLDQQGRPVPILDVARLSEETTYNRLERTNRNRSVSIKSQVYGRPAGSVSRDFQSSIIDNALPVDIKLLFGGATKRTRDGIASMIIALAISIILVYSILAILYNSFFVPMIVLLSLPLALIGAFLALALSGEALSIFSIMGLIILAGLVGKNAILVVNVTQTLQQQGKSVREALIEATRLRFRPILMTNLTMIIGLLPIALSSGAGSEWKNGLAWSLIGGLSSSLLLSLIIVPIFYEAAHQFKLRFFNTGQNLN